MRDPTSEDHLHNSQTYTFKGNKKACSHGIMAGVPHPEIAVQGTVIMWSVWLDVNDPDLGYTWSDSRTCARIRDSTRQGAVSDWYSCVS
jgi:hypothetical protein